MRNLGERVELTAQTTTGCAVGLQSDNRGTELEDHDQGDGQDEAGLNAGQQWAATGRDRGDDPDAKQTRDGPERN
jgi:hypothetical protein